VLGWVGLPTGIISPEPDANRVISGTATLDDVTTGGILIVRWSTVGGLNDIKGMTAIPDVSIGYRMLNEEAYCKWKAWRGPPMKATSTIALNGRVNVLSVVAKSELVDCINISKELTKKSLLIRCARQDLQKGWYGGGMILDTVDELHKSKLKSGIDVKNIFERPTQILPLGVGPKPKVKLKSLSGGADPPGAPGFSRGYQNCQLNS